MNNSISVTDHYTYAKFWRCALQVNPVGYNGAYRGAEHGLGEQDYNRALLDKCLELDIKVVGIADHGSVASVDMLRQTLQPHGIVVFPGFEIASNDKAHFVCLFAEDTSSQQLERYLGTLDLLDPTDGVLPSTLSSAHLIEKVEQLGGFIYAAHCTNERGLLKLRQNHVWQMPKLRAAQIPGSIEDLRGIEDDFYRKAFLNKLNDYRRERPMAVINAKDVAKPEDLEDPGATCWIKMTRPSFAAFKVAFLDPGSRVRLNSDRVQDPIGRILRMSVSGGYLDGVEVTFSDHLNTVIGGRGTGKSTLLECLRYVLDIPPRGKQAQKLHQEILKENLGKSTGRVELEVESSSQNGKRYRISRRYGEYPIVRDVDGNVSTLHPRDLLPGIDIYGQNEIFELAQDDASRLKLLDRFLPQDDDYAQRSAELHKRLKENQSRLVKVLSDFDDLKAEVERLPKLEEQLQGFKSLGIQEKLSKTPLLVRERQIAERASEELQRLREGVATLRDSLPDLAFISDKALTGLPDTEQLLPMRALLEALQQNFSRHLDTMETELRESDGRFQSLMVQWKASLQTHEVELEKALRSLPSMAGKSGPEVGVAYQRLMQDIERIKPLKTRLGNFENLRANEEQARRNLLAELSDLRGQRIAALQTAAKRLNRRLEGKLKVDIVAEADRTPLKRFLLGCNLEGVGERRLAWIDELDGVSSLTLAQSIRQGAEFIQASFELTPLVAEALARLQPSQLMELEALELDHRVDISLNVAHQGAAPVFRALDKLSTGQQCTAILHMLLLENVDPLIMDQPEDNLDNAFIAERIVSELREAKTSRQFLFATHNANIPVFGDAEWIGVFTASENHGSLGVEAQGSIDVPAIRDQVASILEGGRDAFIQRKEKYEF
ncbi:TrlF family AAA-like ATPase [Azoarcus sp. KH32C]|uniref:TrlF family AAA-like ATPase n=1 Tax=Azoarcus sp. KH32C TaxID=748247 RepID=UPI0002385FC7|nr:AAA family ATPase [Azoarcus sp. KH32C]BAL23490.1 SMC domain protein [Azoarcus sp. KH32C]